MTDHEDDGDPIAETYARGLACERAGDSAGAAAAWRALLALDPEDRGGAAMRLASLGERAAPERAAPAYVATLFDQHAEVFESILVDQLGYHAPLELRRTLQERGVARLGRLLDLGCGTGLAGESLEDMADRLTGVDLSEGMIAIADEKEIYHELFVGDAEGFLEATDEAFDTIVATDVLPYLGDVSRLFALAAARLSAGGLFAFTTETLAPEAFGAQGYVVGPRQRFAHAPDWLAERLVEAGFEPPALLPLVVRYEDGAPIPGHLALAVRTSDS